MHYKNITLPFQFYRKSYNNARFSLCILLPLSSCSKLCYGLLCDRLFNGNKNLKKLHVSCDIRSQNQIKVSNIVF